jgi:predicted ATP-grasp superfamily ATP-dependent carboligase
MDGSISALRPLRKDFEQQGAVIALASEAALEVANDKRKTLGLAQALGIAFPRSASITSCADIRVALSEVGYPAVIKPTQSWVRSNEGGVRVTSQVVLNEQEARACVGGLCDLGSSAVAQQWVGGSREAVSLVYARRRVWAEFAQVAHRMTPVLGGVSVIRESIPMPPDLRLMALKLVDALDLEGYCEIEFRRDAAGCPLLMEINARLSGSLEVAVRSGVDFPGLYWRWAAGEPLSAGSGYRTGIRMRFLAGDFEWLWENIKVRGRPDSVAPLRAVTMFAGEFLRPNIYDYFDRHDLHPAWVALARDVAEARKRRSAKGVPWSQVLRLFVSGPRKGNDD